MSLVEPDTGELTVLLTKDEAIALTAKIKSYAGVLCQLVKEAHDKQAWRAMGYGSWTAYTKAEFDISRSRAYQLIKYAEVAVGLAAVAQVPVAAITDALPEGSARNVTPDTIDEVSTAVDTLGPDATLEDRLDAAMAKVKEASPSPAVLAARKRREAEAAEPEQGPVPDPAPVPDTSTDAPVPPGELVDGTGGPAAPGASSGRTPDHVSDEGDQRGEGPEPAPAPLVATIEYSARLTVFDLLDTLPDAAANTTDTDLIGMVDDLADWCHRFFTARKEMAA